MIQQDVVRIDAGALSEEIREGGGVGVQRASAPGQHGKIFFAEVVRAAGERVGARHIDSPEIIFAGGQCRHDVPEFILNVARDASGIMILDQFDLRCRDAQ